jgi:hypothetical protein
LKEEASRNNRYLGDRLLRTQPLLRIEQAQALSIQAGIRRSSRQKMPAISIPALQQYNSTSKSCFR